MHSAAERLVGTPYTAVLQHELFESHFTVLRLSGPFGCKTKDCAIVYTSIVAYCALQRPYPLLQHVRTLALHLYFEHHPLAYELNWVQTYKRQNSAASLLSTLLGAIVPDPVSARPMYCNQQRSAAEKLPPLTSRNDDSQECLQDEAACLSSRGRFRRLSSAEQYSKSTPAFLAAFRTTAAVTFSPNITVKDAEVFACSSCSLCQLHSAQACCRPGRGTCSAWSTGRPQQQQHQHHHCSAATCKPGRQRIQSCCSRYHQ